MKIKDCLACQLNSKAARRYIGDRIYPPEFYGDIDGSPIGQKIYEHMREHDDEIEEAAAKLWDRFRKQQQKLMDKILCG